MAVSVVAAPAEETARVLDADHITAHLIRAAEAVFLDVCYHHLHSDTPAAAQARQFLAGIGCRLEGLRRLPLGLYPLRDELVRRWRAQGIRREIVERARLAGDDRLVGMLVWPVVDAAGNLVTLYARDPIPQQPRMLVRDPWRDLVPAWGIDHARAAGRKGWLAVERFLDALVLWSHGIGPTIVFEDPFDQIGLERWKALFTLPLESLTFLPFGHRDEAPSLSRLRTQLRTCGSNVALWAVPARRLGASAGEWLHRAAAADPTAWVVEHRVPLATTERVRLTMAVDVPPKIGANTSQTASVAGESSVKPAEEPPTPRRKRAKKKRGKQATAPSPEGTGGATAVPPVERTPEGECGMHHCPTTDCFCFD
ncbi:hypothetical protein JCM19992_32700 [Thermostilla marina]